MVGCIKNKVFAAVFVVRRSVAIHTFNTMNHFFLAGQMTIIDRGVGVGRNKGEVEKDKEGIQSVKVLGQRMTWLSKNLSINSKTLYSQRILSMQTSTKAGLPNSNADLRPSLNCSGRSTFCP